MKNQGVWITRIVAFALCVFVIAYMGYHVFSAFGGSIQTVAAVLTATSESLPVSGVVARDESTLSLPSGLIEFTVSEAERVSSGQTIAVSYQNESARLDSNTLREKSNRRAMLNYIANRSGIVLDTAALDSELRLRAAALLSGVSSGSLSDLQQQSVEIKALLFRQTYSYEGTAILLPLIEQLNEEISTLTASLAQTSTALRADSPGLFSPLTDGLETVWTLDVLKGITVSEYHSLSALRSHPPDENKGRLVRGWTWRFVCLMPAYQAKTLGKSVAIRFTGGFSCSMTVDYVSAEEDGHCAVVFSSDRYIDRVISERRLQGELIYGDYEGVRIPADGLRVDRETGEKYVYCLILGRAVRKNVILYSEIERDSYYLAEYHPEISGALLPGDEIIVAGVKDLYDGKILQR